MKKMGLDVDDVSIQTFLMQKDSLEDQEIAF
jgi:hypothetical protein